MRFKVSLRRARNVSLPKNINCVTIIITLKDIEKIKTLKKLALKESEQSREYVSGLI